MRDPTLAHYADILRDDFVSFAHRAHLELYPSRPFEPNWHIDVLAEKLEAVKRGEIRRLIINLPPRSLKSFLGSIVFPAYVLGHNPSAEVLCISYGQEFANDLALPCRSLLQAPFYQALFETRLSDDRQAVEEFKTTAGGARRAASWSGAILGRGADFIVIDDPMKVEEAGSASRRADLNESFHKSIATRLNRDTGAIILIMQRLHANDLTDFVQKGEHWDVVAIPAVAENNEKYNIVTPFGVRKICRPKGHALQPGRQSLQYLNDRRNSQGSRTFDAQYQQKPQSAESAIIQWNWLAYYDENTRPTEFTAKLQSWDTAGKPGEANSYNVCTTWGQYENRLYLLDVFRGRLNYRELKLKAISLARDHEPTTILIEEQSLGSPLASDLGQMGFPVQTVPAGSASKAERLYARANRFESGQILLPRQALWLDDYINELTSFPDSDFSDQVNSTSQALTWDLANAKFQNTLRNVEILNAGNYTPKTKGKIRLLVLPGAGGGVLQFHDGSKRPSINIPGPGELFEIDKATGAKLAQERWKEFQIVND